jgi:hypothetical protein
VVEQEVNEILFLAEREAVLAADKAETVAEFKDKVL